MKNIFNIIGFQICWWNCVLFSTTEMSFIGPIMMFIFIIFHLLYISRNKNELKLIIVVGLLGTLFDSLFIIFNLFSYSSSFIICEYIVPLWITAMWIGFSATLNHSLSWIKKNYNIAFIMGFIFGPISYITGEKFGAIHFHSSNFISIFILAFSWGIIIPIVLLLNKKILIKKINE